MAVVATGFFDGVHLGHRRVISVLVSSARERAEEAIVVTFATHPRAVLQQDARTLRLLSSPAEKAAMLSGSAGMRVPLPHQGGFLGLSVVRSIAALHQGALLIQWLEDDLCRVSLSVPIGTVVPSPDLELNTFLDRGDGVAPWMLWMADALPKAVYDWTQGG